MTAQQELARRHVALWNRVSQGDDAELFAVVEEWGLLKMNAEMTLEVHSEWGALARKLTPAAGSDAGCDCNVCAISRALHETPKRVRRLERAIRDLTAELGRDRSA